MLKLIKLVILSCFLLVGIVGLGNLNQSLAAAPQPQAQAQLFPYSADGQSYGYVDETGAWAIDPQFEFAADFAEGLAVVEQAEKYGYIDAGGNVVIEPQFDFAADFAFGLAPVATNGKFGYINPTGQMIIEAQFNDARPFTADGLAAVMSNQSYGYIDQEGQFVVEPQYKSAFGFSEGLAAVLVHGKYGFIDNSGQMVIAPHFDFTARFSEGLAAVLLDGQVGFIDKSGQIIIEPQFDFAQNFSEGLAAVNVSGLTGFIDPSGQIVIEPQYHFAESFSEGRAAVRIDELIGYIDAAGQMIIEPQFSDAGPFKNGLARVEEAHQWGYINQKGQPIFLLPVSVIAPDSTLIIPFLPGVPSETRDGICLPQSVSVPAPFAWRCIIASDDPDEISIFDPCLVADDGETLVCSADPQVGDPGFQVNLIESLPASAEISTPAVDGDNNRAWLLQLADGATCRFAAGISTTIDGQRANYICSDSSILVGELQPGNVWLAERVSLADVAKTDDGFEATEINPTEIAVIWKPADPVATIEETGLPSGAVTLDPSGVAQTVTPQIRPAIPFVPKLSPHLDGEPAHWRFVFDNEDLPDLGGVYPEHAQLLIYPVAAYQDIYREAEENLVGQRIEALQTLLQERPATVDGEIPVLPAFGNAEQILNAQIKYLDFEGGSGVRFITHYGVGAAPITDHGTLYTFQGLTNDGNYYVAYYHPAPTGLLPGDFEAIADLIKDYDGFVENFDTYLLETADLLNSAETSDFYPDLTDLDTMIESLQIEP